LSSRCGASWASGRVVLSYPGGGNGKQRDMARAPPARDHPPPAPPSTSRRRRLLRLLLVPVPSLLLMVMLAVVLGAVGDASLLARQGAPQPCPPASHPRRNREDLGAELGPEREEDPAAPDRIGYRSPPPSLLFFRSAGDEVLLFRFEGGGGGGEGG
jgi:hypothetical protein